MILLFQCSSSFYRSIDALSPALPLFQERKLSFNSHVEGLYLVKDSKKTTGRPSALYCRLIDVLCFYITDE